jgi:hypothetical protein
MDVAAAAKIAAAIERFRQSGLALLRAALLSNTANRIRGIALDIFQRCFPASHTKTRLVNDIIVDILSKLPPLAEEIAQGIADLGIVKVPSANLVVDDVVFIRKNAMDNNGQACVIACESLAGWIIREGSLVLIDSIRLRDINWGRLAEKRKTTTILE